MEKFKELMEKILEKLSSKPILSALFIISIADVAFLTSLNYDISLNSVDFKYKSIVLNLGLLILFALLILLFLTFNFIMKSIKDITQYAKVLSDGKLNTSDIIIHGSNDFNMLARAINNLKSNLLFFLNQTKENILVLSDSIENVSESMHMVFTENQQVASTMQEIACKSQEQLNGVTDTTTKTDEVQKSIDNIALNIKKVKVIASDASTAATTGKESLNIYNDNINLISKSISETHEFIAELKLSVHQIGSVVNFIIGLSKQLKLLSLNASIEAERSGGEGRSFAVVANEITKLSDSTKEGIDKINSIIANILEGSNNVEDSIEKSINYFESGKEVFSKVEKLFNEIGEKSIVLLNQVSDIAEEASNINNNIKDTVKLCKKVNDSSEVVSQSTDEVVALIEEELEEFQEINLATSQLSAVLTKIESLVTRFNLDIKPIKENPRKPLRIAMIIPAFGGIWDVIHFGARYGNKVLKSKNTVVEIIPLNKYSQEDCLNAINNCLQKGCDGIVTPGFIVDSLRNKINTNVPIVTFNIDTKSKNRRIAYIGENSYQSGIVGAKTMIEQIGVRGKILIITSDQRLENFELRKQGFEDGISKNKNIELADTLEVPLENENVYRIVKGYLKKNANINGIFCITSGVLGLARAIEELNMSRNLKTIVFYDKTKEILEYINKGVITCTIGQNPFRQGYDSLIYMYNYLVTGEKPDEEKTWIKVEIMDANKTKNFLG